LATLLLAPNHTYRFRARATDVAGNQGPWTEGAGMALSSHTESSKSVTYSGTWKKLASSAYWNGRARSSSTAGAKASIRVNARSISWVSRFGPTRGKATVYVDGKSVATVNLYRTSATGPRVAWTRTWATPGVHRVTIRVSGTKGHPSVIVDGFIVSR
jgi:hypothetical protein